MKSCNGRSRDERLRIRSSGLSQGRAELEHVDMVPILQLRFACLAKLVSTPIKLREAVLRARAEGRTYEDIAALLGIGRATVNRLLRLHRETSSLKCRRAREIAAI